MGEIAPASTSLPPSAAAASEAAVRAALKETNAANQPTAEGAAEKPAKDELEDGEIKEPKKTVFDDPDTFNIVHPLAHTWTLWFDNASKQDKAKDWNEQLQQVMDIKSVEEFWGLYNNIVPPSHIAISSNYYLFKKGIKPAWEDSANAKGGKWAVQLPRDKSARDIDRWWLYTMLAAIGETLEVPYTSDDSAPSSTAFTDEVTGVIVSSRKMFYRLNIWTRSSDSREKVEDIGKQFKYHVLAVPEGKKLASEASKSGIASDVEFSAHSAAQSRTKKSNTWTV